MTHDLERCARFEDMACQISLPDLNAPVAPANFESQSGASTTLMVFSHDRWQERESDRINDVGCLVPRDKSGTTSFGEPGTHAFRFFLACPTQQRVLSGPEVWGSV